MTTSGTHAVDRAHAGADDRMGGLERRVVGDDRQELVEHAEEAAVVGLAPVAAGALALLDDVVDRLAGCRRVDDRHELRPAERRAGSPALLAGR